MEFTLTQSSISANASVYMYHCCTKNPASAFPFQPDADTPLRVWDKKLQRFYPSIGVPFSPRPKIVVAFSLLLLLLPLKLGCSVSSCLFDRAAPFLTQ